MAELQYLTSLREFTTEDVQYRVAATRAEREAAFRLVYEAYVRAGLAKPNPHRMRVTPYQILPTSDIFLATVDDHPIFTMTLVRDGSLGLPLESVFPELVAERRNQGISMAEISCLAAYHAVGPRKSFPVFIRLAKLVAQFALRCGVEQLLIAVHPRHARFYQRYTAFEPISDLRVYPGVENNPAVAMYLDYAKVAAERPDVYDTFMGDPFPEHLYRPQPIDPQDQAYFATMLDLHDETPVVAGAEVFGAAATKAER